MAFEQNLEADRIDGFNIFSAFVRVPLLVLGGILGADESSAASNMDCDSGINHHHGRSMDVDDDNTPRSDLDPQFRVAATDCTNVSIQRRLSDATSTQDSMQTKPQECKSDHFRNNQGGMKRTKKMSWSDESGLPLVYENDESALHHDPNSNPYSSATSSLQRPTKSAMRKSRSVRHEAGGLSHQDRITSVGASRYIPNMNPRTAGNGLIMPTRPYGGHPSVENKTHGPSNAEMSPQWGWYINTTPPTPELYHKRSSSCSSALNKQQTVKFDSNTNGTQKSSTTPLTSTTIDAKSCQNQVFQDLQNSTKRNPMGGWTSIPI